VKPESCAARDMLVVISQSCNAKRRGGTGVLFWDGDLWYRSAIAAGRSESQTRGCVGKVCTTKLNPVVPSLRHPVDAKWPDEARRSKVVKGQQ
jgi:hypothetical protein